MGSASVAVVIGSVASPAGPGVARVSLYLLPARTGRGLGVDAMRQGCELAFRKLRVDSIEALVRDDNQRSVTMCVRAGFSPSDRPVEPGSQLLVIRRHREPGGRHGDGEE